MAVVPRVLLDHVEQDPAQAGCLTAGPGAPERTEWLRSEFLRTPHPRSREKDPISTFPLSRAAACP